MSDQYLLASSLTVDPQKLRIRFGSIVSVENDRTCTVSIAGMATSVAKVKYLSSPPRPNSSVILITDGQDLFVLDHVAAASNSLATTATRSTDQTLTNATDTAIVFDGSNGDGFSVWAASPNADRLTVPITGRYIAVGNVSFATNATGLRSVWVEKNGSTTIGRTNQLSVGGGSPTIISLTATAASLTKADYLRLMVSQNSGGNLNVSGGTVYPTFSLIYLGP